ncbi:hypothetical protein R5C62_002976 [Salmonella enterica]|nr:hypothetical protein [Salmonella enterica]
MTESDMMDMIIYYSRLITGRILKPLYLNYCSDDLANELRLLILSINDALAKGEVILSVMDEMEFIIADGSICYLEKNKGTLKGIGNYLKQCGSSSCKKDTKNDISILMDEAILVCNKGCEQMGELIRRSRRTRCLLWLHP